MKSALLLALVFIFQVGVWSLRDVRLRVPAAVRAGGTITVSCAYSMLQEPLYSVKFYLGDTEFYRYVPMHSPPVRVFAFRGVSVTLQLVSDHNSTVTLSRVSRQLTGLYKCEVSTDAPLFYTVIDSAFLVVTKDPHTKPVIRTSLPHYSLGETVLANCSSEGGDPAANLTWLVNGQPLQDSMVNSSSYHTLEGVVNISVLELWLLMSPGVIEGGVLRLSCVASQFAVYNETTELVLTPCPQQVSLPVSTLPVNVAGYFKSGRSSWMLLTALLGRLLVAGPFRS